MKQDQYSPLSVEKQVLIIFAATNGFLDDILVKDCLAFERELYSWIEVSRPEVLKDILRKKTLDDELKGQVKSALTEFKKQFVAKTAA